MKRKLLAIGLLFCIGCASSIKELSNNNTCILLQGHQFSVGVDPITKVPGVHYIGGTVIRYNPESNLKVKVSNNLQDNTVTISGDFSKAYPVPNPSPIPSFTPSPIPSST